MSDTMEKKAVSSEPAEKIWIVVGDIHGNTGKFTEIPGLANASGVIVTGDLTNLGGSSAAQKVLNVIGQNGLPVLAQIGNMDKEEVDVMLTGKGCNLHGNVVELTPDVAVFGIGGSTITPFRTPSEFSEDEYAQWLNGEWEKASKYPHKVLISHNPPKDTACDDIGGNVHVGSISVRKFLEDRQPDFCLCGHIHEGKARDAIGRTIVINPGTLAEGGYVLLKLKDGELTAELCDIPD